jgi:hypothetical protein
MINPKAVNLYLESKGITVTGNTDQYYRLSGDTIKQWSVDIPEPTLTDLTPYEKQVSAEETAAREKTEAINTLSQTDADMARFFEDYLLTNASSFIAGLTGKQKEKWDKRMAAAQKVRK